MANTALHSLVLTGIHVHFITKVNNIDGKCHIQQPFKVVINQWFISHS